MRRLMSKLHSRFNLIWSPEDSKKLEQLALALDLSKTKVLKKAVKDLYNLNKDLVNSVNPISEMETEQ